MLDKITRDEGRFKKIDQNRNLDKISSSYSQWDLSDNKKMPYIDSVSHYLHDKKPNQYKKTEREPGNTSHFDIEMDKKTFNYTGVKTEFSKNFPKQDNANSKSKTTENFKGRKGNIHLGEARPDYLSTYTKNNNSLENKYDDIQYKRTERNYDILSNKEKPSEKLKKAAAFDFHNPYQDRKRISHDRPQLQAGYNIITWNGN